MGKKNKYKTRNLIRKSAQLETRSEGLRRSKFIVFGLKYFDQNQGQQFKEWELKNILSLALERIQGLCSMTVHEAIESQILKIYGNKLPPKSKFTWPKHIPDDIQWARIAVQGQERIIGFIESEHIFQVVFLDINHDFYPSHKKNT